MAENWPIGAADLRKALGFRPDQGDTPELDLYAASASVRIDAHTGRTVEPERHEVGGALPEVFVLAARETAKLWWQQSRNGPRGLPQDPDSRSGPPMGADLPYRVVGWLAAYPPPPGIA
ncbi:MAG: hypothetical protein LBG60_15030 [Bifidobacteriaceae bacterium]|jgi:hypothetical protein|nr:hypothetical protein [Bifidobacteriaceae bacterium]